MVTRQIEEQREGVEQALRDSEARTRALLEASPDMVFRLDREGRYLDFHAGDEALLAAPPEEFMGRKLSDIFSPALANSFQQHINKACETKELQLTEYELPIQGANREFEARFVRISETEVVGIVRDITERKRGERQLRLSEAHLKEAQRIAKLGNWERDLATNEVWWSEETYRILGVDFEKSVGSYDVVIQAAHPDDRQRVIETLASAQRRAEPTEFDFRILLPDGTAKTAHAHAEAVSDEKGRLRRLIGTIQDITEQAQLEREVLTAKEHERRRIGRDLHDGLGQELTGMSLRLKSLSQALERDQSPHVHAVQDATKMLQGMIADTRRIAGALTPGFSTGLEMDAAFRALAKEVNSSSDVKCQVHCSGADGINDEELLTHLYRIAQEAISNVLRHAKAQTIELSFKRSEGSLFLEVLDDGIGIPPKRDRGDGMGLKNMRYRARMIHGRLDVSPRGHGGTRVLCSCSFSPD